MAPAAVLPDRPEARASFYASVAAHLADRGEALRKLRAADQTPGSSISTFVPPQDLRDVTNQMKMLCQAKGGELHILQGNIAFATGCVRGGVHAADGYPGTPSSEVISFGFQMLGRATTRTWFAVECLRIW